MKLNRRCMLAFLAMILSVALLMPCLVSCAGEEAAQESATQEEKKEETKEPATKPNQNNQAENSGSANVGPGMGGGDYIPPENVIDYEGAESLESTPNVGGAGNMVVTGGDGMMSSTAYEEYLKENPHLLGNPTDRRNAVEAAMRAMLTVRWTPTAETVYSYNPLAYTDRNTVNETEFEKDQITLEKGKVYQGLPYTLGSAGLEAFLYGLAPTAGVYSIPLFSRALSGSSVISARVGADAADMVFWALAKVAPSVKFTSTSNMTEANGLLPVGEYEMTGVTDTLAGLTDDVASANGTDVMYESYAALQKADVLFADTDALSHAMLVVSVSVAKNPDGSINPNESYVIVLEQTDKNLLAYEALSDTEKEAKMGEVLVIGGIDVKYTFAQLYSDGFLPVTVSEFSLIGPLNNVYMGDTYRKTYSFTKSSIYAGTVSSSRRFVYLNTVIRDASGNAVINTTAFATEEGVTGGLFTYKMSNWNVAGEGSRCYGDPALTVLKSGEKYTLTQTAYLSTGETVNLRSYSFTY